jgi:hypothetical protein
VTIHTQEKDRLTRVRAKGGRSSGKVSDLYSGIPDTDTHRNTGYSEVFVVFLISSRQNVGHNIDQNITGSFKILSNSLLINHLSFDDIQSG